ncbi:Hyalurononglucosaminidase, putative [Pediculus humanus corporis]|uniref:Hyaluronidase n=1 Tax=Pediculus humanus subsp. corporis TaxID=121224 RepID=E0VLE8_PEDHC|nr:Hyalurononglucosaminidase, putative [Pediculus humanus corporis]EEB14204.1 Hyalurononglucosaminidase, putative [Pediculus humanus corporis]
MLIFLIKLSTVFTIIIIIIPNVTSIKINRGSQPPESNRGFKVFWNVPTEQCKKYEIDFESLIRTYGIIGNERDSFRGEKVTILYDPGDFPIIKKFQNKTQRYYNGGFPQNGSLSKHLKKLKNDTRKYANVNLNGLGIIDFEVWRPVFRQNWNEQIIYKNKSIELAQHLKNNGSLNGKSVNASAKEEFEKHAKKFMLETLEDVKKLRPGGKWGYYGFPYCYNYRVNNTPECPEIAVRENNEILWLFNESSALYPSLYLKQSYNSSEHVKFMIGVLNEAYRISAMTNYIPVYPYVRFKYLDTDEYLTQEDAYNSFEIPRQYQMGGIILWGKSSDLNDEGKCLKFYNYVIDIVGPALNKSLTMGNKTNSTITTTDF